MDTLDNAMLYVIIPFFIGLLLSLTFSKKSKDKGD